MTIVKSLLLFVAAAVAEIGGAWLVWQGVRENKGLVWVGAGVVALGQHGFVGTLQPLPTSAGLLLPTAWCLSLARSSGVW